MGLLYTNLKIFHHKEKIDSLEGADGAILPPVHIRIKPTNICNHRCRYCAYRSEDLQLGRDMGARDVIPRDKMLEIVDDLEEMGVEAVTFSGGGEPFCYPHLLETVKRLSGTPIRFASLTNGSGLKGEVAEIFASRGTWIRVSIDGWDGPSYAAYRGVGDGEFAKVMGNMESFKKLGGGCLAGASIIVDRDNADHLYDLIGTLQGAGFDSVKVSPTIVHNEGRENNRYHEPFFQKVKSQVGRAEDDFAGDGFEIYDSYHLLEEKFAKAYGWCPYLQILPVIGADMNVYSCQDKAYNLSSGCLGSIAEQRFREFWFEDKRRFFRIDPSRECDHHCVANSKNKMILEYLNADAGHRMFV